MAAVSSDGGGMRFMEANVRAERAATDRAAWPWRGQFTCWPRKGQVALPVEVRSSEGLGLSARPCGHGRVRVQLPTNHPSTLR